MSRAKGLWCGMALAGWLGATTATGQPPLPPKAGPESGVVVPIRLNVQQPEPTPTPTPATEPAAPVPQPPIPGDTGAINAPAIVTPPDTPNAPSDFPVGALPPNNSNTPLVTPNPGGNANANANATTGSVPPPMSPEQLRSLRHYSGILPEGPLQGRAANLFELIQDPEAELSVVVGRIRVIQLREIPKKISIGDPSVVTLTWPPISTQNQGGNANPQAQPQTPDEQKLFTLLGLSVGTTNFTIWDSQNRPVSFLVRVSIDTRDLEGRLRTIFPGADIRVSQSANLIILDGQVPDAKTMQDVLRMVEATLTRGSTTGVTQTGVVGVQVNQSGGQQVAGAGASIRPQIINRVRIPGPRQVMLKVKLAELNRTALREMGVNWLRTKNDQLMGSLVGNFAGINGTSNTALTSSFTPRAFSLPGTAGGSLIPGSVSGGTQTGIDSIFNATARAASSADSQLFGIFKAGEFDLFINALRSNGLATILAEPNIMAMDGQPARFIAGGEFPFPVPQVQGGGGGGGAVITIQFRPFGAILTFIPYIQANGLIRLDVEPIFSQLNFGAGTSVAGTTVPGLNQRSARTVVELRENQSLALAGLVQKTTNASSVKVPLLGDIPIAGQLFSRSTINTQETELIVIVTPTLVAPMESKEMPAGPGENVLEPNDLEFYFLGRTEGKTGHPHRATTQHLDPFNVHRHFRSEGQWVIGPHGHSAD